MIKKVINFLDKHRFILVLLILFLISLLFLSFNSIRFLSHDFKNLNCTKKIDNKYCYNNDNKIFINGKVEQKTFFEKNKKQINKLKKDYDLPEFNNYTSYYYEVASLLEYNSLNNKKELYNFFDIYNNTYNIESFYLKNSFYYEIFYPYKVL